MLEFDEYDLNKTADVLMVMNKSIAENGYDKIMLIQFMQTMGNLYLSEKNGCMSTFGFVLTSYEGSDRKRRIRASVSPSIVEHYLTNVQKRLDNILEAA